MWKPEEESFPSGRSHQQQQELDSWLIDGSRDGKVRAPKMSRDTRDVTAGEVGSWNINARNKDEAKRRA